MKSRKRLLTLLFPVLAVVLEALPFGVALHFMSPPGVKPNPPMMFSYFDLTPYGYADFPPLITAVLTCVILVLAVVAVFRKKKTVMKALFVLSLIAFLVSVAPILYVPRSYTVISACISAALLAEAVVSWLCVKEKN